MKVVLQIKKIIFTILGSIIGIRIVPLRRGSFVKNRFCHERLISNATYSPWMENARFTRIFNNISSFTLIDRFRSYELYTLAAQCNSIDGAYLEVGAWRGGSSALIQSARMTSLESLSSDFYVADTFTGVVKSISDKDSFYVDGEHADTSVEQFEQLFTRLKIPHPTILTGIFPDAHERLDIPRLAFVHIDVDTYQSAKDIFNWVDAKMSRGGVIIFDDYGFATCDGVTEVVNEISADPLLCSKYIFLYNLNGHAILIRK